jgi:hypothetical protein
MLPEAEARSRPGGVESDLARTDAIKAKRRAGRLTDQAAGFFS